MYVNLESDQHNKWYVVIRTHFSILITGSLASSILYSEQKIIICKAEEVLGVLNMSVARPIPAQGSQSVSYASRLVACCYSRLTIDMQIEAHP
jgi:hypothetical protein